jgi:hypothetical protein
MALPVLDVRAECPRKWIVAPDTAWPLDLVLKLKQVS